MRVQIPPQALEQEEVKAYLIGLSLGDGNLSNPNGRAVRLRITCDKKYPLLIDEIIRVIKIVLPKNRVSALDRVNCTDVYAYSNSLPALLGWKWYGGPKDIQNVGVPEWIKAEPKYVRICLRGLFQTDGSLYNDRGYMMLNFTNTCVRLSNDTLQLMVGLGYKPNMQKLLQANGKTKHTIRLSREVDKFIKEIGFWKR